MVKRRADRKWKLSSLFWRYLVTTGVMVAVCTVLWWMAVVACISVGFVYQASVGARNLQKTQERLLRQEEFQGEEIPFYYDWCLVSEDGTVLQAKMSEKVLKQAKNVEGDDGMRVFPYSKFFHAVSLKDGSRCVLAYDYSMPYVNPMLQRYLPDFQVTATLLLFVCWGVIAVTRTRKYTKILQNDTRAVRAAADLVASQRLDEPILPEGKIRELNDALETIEKLRVELAASLSRQWAMEEQRNQELASLSHDLKTPLTVIRGNAELLEEEELASWQEASVEAILRGTLHLEEYVQELRSVAAGSGESSEEFRKLPLKKFIERCREDGEALCAAKKISLKVCMGEEVARQSEEGFSFRGQEMQLLRAIRNLIDNAVRFSKEGQEIVLEVQEKDGRLIFTVQDSGPGFCQEALAKAGKIFYTSEKHRASEGHLGLGLYFCCKVAARHGGGLKIENGEKGGRATLVIVYGYLGDLG